MYVLAGDQVVLKSTIRPYNESSFSSIVSDIMQNFSSKFLDFWHHTFIDCEEWIPMIIIYKSHKNGLQNQWNNAVNPFSIVGVAQLKLMALPLLPTPSIWLWIEAYTLQLPTVMCGWTVCTVPSILEMPPTLCLHLKKLEKIAWATKIYPGVGKGGLKLATFLCEKTLQDPGTNGSFLHSFVYPQ